MSKTYTINVNKTYSFSFNEKEIKSLDIVKSLQNKYHILHNNQSFNAKVFETNFCERTYTIKVNGNLYKVKISNELDVLIAKLGLEASTRKKENNLKAPMPGLVVSIDVKVGQEVAEGDVILILEAMKMENALTAPCNGVIKSIKVHEGEKVEKNTILIEMKV